MKYKMNLMKKIIKCNKFDCYYPKEAVAQNLF